MAQRSKRQVLKAIRMSIAKWIKKEEWLNQQPRDERVNHDKIRLEIGQGFGHEDCPLCLLYADGYVYDCDLCPLGIYYGLCLSRKKGRLGVNAYDDSPTWGGRAKVAKKLIHQLRMCLKYVEKEW